MRPVLAREVELCWRAKGAREVHYGYDRETTRLRTTETVSRDRQAMAEGSCGLEALVREACGDESKYRLTLIPRLLSLPVVFRSTSLGFDASRGPRMYLD